MSDDSLEGKALALIKSRPNGILQSDLWKDLKIDSRKCSRVIAKLEAEGKIKRTWETVKGTRTYRISYLPQKKEAPKKEVNFGLIIAREQVAPCIGCTYECEPDYCPDLGNWIALLARAPVEQAPKAARALTPAAKAKEPVKPEAEVEEAVMAKGKKAVKVPRAAKVEKSTKGARVAVSAKSAKPVKETSTKPSKVVKSTKSSKK